MIFNFDFESKFTASSRGNNCIVPEERLHDAILNDSANKKTVNIAVQSLRVVK